MDIIEKTALVLKNTPRDVFCIWSMGIRGMGQSEIERIFVNWQKDKHIPYDLREFCNSILFDTGKDVEDVHSF